MRCDLRFQLARGMTLAWAILLPLSSLGVGKIGNGRVGSSVLGFEVPIAQRFCQGEFCFDRPSRPGTVVLETPESASQIGFGLHRGPTLVWLADYSAMYPELKRLSRAELRKHFLDRPTQSQWVSVPAKDPCVEILLGVSGDSVTLVAAWGEERGVVMAGPSTADIQSAIVEMGTQIQLYAGACRW